MNITSRKRSVCKNKSCKLKPKSIKAISILAPNKDDIKGCVLFTQKNNTLIIDYEIEGLTDGEHGFHIHEYGDLSDGCDSACSHFNPFNKKHGGLNSKERHAGDLGNIISNNMYSKGQIKTNNLSILNNRLGIVGRMIIIHEDRDDLGKGNNEESLKTGNAGKRVACGVIGLKK
tara:strand:+ start:44 stop:565 length:522 start_codon:yes stop_codon:yes gene_type:complete